MVLHKRYWTILAASICLAAPLATSDTAAAEVPTSAAPTPGMQALMRSPAIQRGRALLLKGDGRSALPYFLAAAKEGNPLGALFLGRLYYEGHGIPRNYGQSLKWLKLALTSHHEQLRAMAEDMLHTISTTLRNSPDPSDRQMAMAAAILPLAAMLPQNARGRGYAPAQGSVGDGLIGAYIGHQLFDDSSDE